MSALVGQSHLVAWAQSYRSHPLPSGGNVNHCVHRLATMATQFAKWRCPTRARAHQRSSRVQSQRDYEFRYPKLNTHPDSARMGQLDVMRAIACMLVLVAHLDTVYGMPELPTETGPIGVAIFFALSGYLITRGLLRRSDEQLRQTETLISPAAQRSALASFDLAGFYIKRATRILPPYMLVLLILAFFWQDERLAWCATFTFNFLYISGARDYFHVQQLSTSIPPIGHNVELVCRRALLLAWPLVLAQFGRKDRVGF